MANSVFQILPVSDDDLFAAIHALWTELGAPPSAAYSVTLVDGGNLRAPSGPIAQMDADPILAQIRSSRMVVSRQVSMSMPELLQFSLSIQRGSPTGALDTVNLNFQDNLEPAAGAKFVVSARAAFGRFMPSPQLDQTLGPALTEFYRRREAGLLELEALSQRLIEQNAAYRQEVDVAAAADRRQLREQLEEERRLAAEREQASMEVLKVREAKLAAQLNDIDDRSNTHARRQIRSDLKKVLADRSTAFELSKATNSKRLPIHWLFGLWIITSGALVIRTILGGVATPWAIGELAASALSLIGSTAFYIRWNDNWAREHAQEEFRMRRLDLDVDRASWVVEVALEWKEEKGNQIPPELLDRLTNNLFSEGAKLDRARHPIEDLSAALLGASTALKLGLPGGELSIDRKGIQRFQKEASRSDA
jgi:hypothetical protein